MRKTCLFAFVFVCCLHLLVPNVSFSGTIVKSKTLSNDDVTDAVKTHLAQRGERFIRIIGIYQKDKEATVYYWYAEGGNRERGYQMQFVQLNSGEWINPKSYQVLTK